MSEINVFVDEKILGQLFPDNVDRNLTLAEAKKTLFEDVQDLIPPTYRFLKPLSKSDGLKVPIAPRQEEQITLGKCLVENDDELSIYLQSCKEVVKEDKNEKSAYYAEPDLEPSPKRLKQTRLDDFRPESNARNRIDPLSVARGRVHIYTERDIERATPGRKDYFRLWNEKAVNLCSDQTYNGHKKQELHGIIDTAWKIKLCDILTTKAEEELELSGSSKTVSRNLKRLGQAKNSVNEINGKVSQLKKLFSKYRGNAVRQELKEMEEELSKTMVEVKLAQDALRKSITNSQQKRELESRKKVNKAVGKDKGKNESDEGSERADMEGDECCPSISEQGDDYCPSIDDEIVNQLAESRKNDDW